MDRSDQQVPGNGSFRAARLSVAMADNGRVAAWQLNREPIGGSWAGNCRSGVPS